MAACKRCGSDLAADERCSNCDAPDTVTGALRAELDLPGGGKRGARAAFWLFHFALIGAAAFVSHALLSQRLRAPKSPIGTTKKTVSPLAHQAKSVKRRAVQGRKVAGPVRVPVRRKSSRVPARAHRSGGASSPGSRPLVRADAASSPVAQAGRDAGGGADAGASGRERIRVRYNAQSVQLMVRRYTPQLASCVERITKRGQDVGGRVEIKFRVGANGRVSGASVHRNTTGHAQLGRCIAGKLAGWRFPRPVGGAADFIYPFLFSARE